VNEDLFAIGGPEGRNADSDDYETRLNLAAIELGHTVVDVNVDTVIGDSARSQGLDAIAKCSQLLERVPELVSESPVRFVELPKQSGDGHAKGSA
jgi:hypothetical protein